MSWTVIKRPGLRIRMLIDRSFSRELELGARDRLEAHAVAGGEQARLLALGDEHRERRAADDAPAPGDGVGIDHRLVVGGRHRAPPPNGARRCAPPPPEPWVSPPQ